MEEYTKQEIAFRAGPAPASAAPNAAAASPSQENKVMIMGYDVVFPHGKRPFPAQLAVMNKVLVALKSGQHALLESPTGSGKTLALLCSSLTFQKQFVKEMVENQRIRNEEAQKKGQNPESKEPSIMEIRDDNGNRLPPTPSTQLAGDDDDDFASTQPTFDQFRFGNGATMDDAGWISMGDKKRSAEPPQPPPKRRQLPGSFAAVAANAEKLTKQEQHGSLEDFHNASSSAAARPTQKRFTPPTIFFCSRTHSQLAQVVDELKSCPASYLSSPDASNPFSESLKTCVLGSKSHYCVNGKVNRDVSLIDDKCRDAVEGNQCSYFRKRRKTNDLRRVAPPVWDLEDLVKLAKKHRECAFFHARDALAEAHIVFCPYNYLLDPSIREAVNISLKNAIIVLDEAHNVEDTCRSSASLELTIDVLTLAIASFTEVIRKGKRPTIYLAPLKVLNGVHRWLKNIAAASSTMLKPSGFEEESRVWRGADCLAMFAEYACMTKETFPQLQKDMKAVAEYEKQLAVEAAQRQGRPAPPMASSSSPGGGDVSSSQEQGLEGSDYRLSAVAMGTIRKILNVAEYMYRDDLKYLDDFKLIVMKARSRRGGGGRFGGGRGGRGGGRGGGGGYDSGGDSEWQIKMCIWCLNAAVAFSDVVREARSVILTSGTLSPMDSFAGELGTDFPIRLEANHVVNIRRQVFIGAVMQGPGGVDLSATFKNQQEFRYQDSMGELLLQFASVVPGGVLMFFPSYSLLDKLQTRWRQTGVWTKLETCKTMFTEPRQAGKDFDALLDEYKATIAACMASGPPQPRTGAIFLAVYRGKVSEGIDFSNANARAVLAVGIPFPNVKELQVSLKREYQDEKSVGDRTLVTGSQWYELQAFRALNQALGRCIRHRQDYGAIVLLDSRYRFQKHTKSLSKWIRPHVREFEHAHECVPMLTPFFQLNARELGVTGPSPIAVAVVKREPMALQYEAAAESRPRTLQATTESVRAYLAKRSAAEDQPRVFSIFGAAAATPSVKREPN